MPTFLIRALGGARSVRVGVLQLFELADTAAPPSVELADLLPWGWVYLE